MALKFLGGASCALFSFTGLSNSLYEDDPFWRSRSNVKPSDIPEKGFLIFTGNSNIPLATEIASHLGTPLGRAKVARFADGEISIKVFEHLRGRDTYIIQSTCPPVNENLMELLLLISTLRRASAKKITAVMPYYGYARQDRKMMSRVPISAADVAKLIEAMGVDRVIACDMHCGQIQGFFSPRVPVDNLDAGIVAMQYYGGLGLVHPVIVSPDSGGVYRAKRFQEFVNVGESPGLAMIIKQRSEAGKVDRMDLVGTVQGCDAVIVDDMIDTAGTLCAAAQVLKDKGARRVFAFATHGLFSREAVKTIEESALDGVIVTNTIPLSGSYKSTKIKQVSVGTLLAEAIRRAHQKESVSELFEQTGN